MVELVAYSLKLRKKELYEAIAQSGALHNINTLLAQYSWNNFLQLKVLMIYEEIFESTQTSLYRKLLLENSKIAETLIHLAKEVNYTHESERHFRHGYMAAVIKLGNFLQKNYDKDDMKEYLDSLGDDWTEFANGELKKSNEINGRSLGGHQPRSSPGEDVDEENHYEVNMEKIMQRFSNFNSLVASNSKEDDDDDYEDNKQDNDLKKINDEVDIDREDGEDDDNFRHLEKQEPMVVEQEPLVSEYTDNNYWHTNHLNKSVEDLIAEMDQ